MSISAQQPSLFREFSQQRLSQLEQRRQPGSGSREDYIVMPPAGGDLFKSEVDAKEVVESLGGQVNESLDLIKGYLTSLSSKEAAALVKRGFRVVPDKVENFLPPDPVQLEEPENSPTENSPTKAGKKVAPFQPRPLMTEPRFDSELTRTYTGKDVTIAVLDTGIHPHPDLQGRLLGQVDFVQGLPMAYDDNGHGTHVAGCAAGDGMMSEGIHKGLASEANVVGVKVLGADGSGRNSDIIKGLEWCIEQKEELGIRVVNMSLGGPASRDWEEDPINQAVKAAHEAGLVVMVAAGNEGPGRSTIGSPGDSPFAITVGAVDDGDTPDPSDDKMAPFSSRGPTKDGRSKPDVVAPGEHIFAAMAPNTEKMRSGMKNGVLHQALRGLDELPYRTLQRLPDETFLAMGLSEKTVDKLRGGSEAAQREFNRLLETTSRAEIHPTQAYQALPGTSMATPIAAGLVGSLLEANPQLTPEQVREILVSTADKLPGKWGPNSQGAGMIDPDEALQRALTYSQAPAASEQPTTTT